MEFGVCGLGWPRWSAGSVSRVSAVVSAYRRCWTVEDADWHDGGWHTMMVGGTPSLVCLLVDGITNAFLAVSTARCQNTLTWHSGGYLDTMA